MSYKFLTWKTISKQQGLAYCYIVTHVHVIMINFHKINHVILYSIYFKATFIRVDFILQLTGGKLVHDNFFHDHTFCTLVLI